MPARYHFTINDDSVLQFFKHQCFNISSTSALKNEAHNKNIIIRNNNNIIISVDSEILQDTKKIEEVSKSESYEAIYKIFPHARKTNKAI